MDETTAKEYLARLEARVVKLAREKSYLQLVNDLMENLSVAPGLESTVEAILRRILDAVGGSNALLYFTMDGVLRSGDVFGARKSYERPDDALVQKAYDTVGPVEEAQAFSDTKMTTPEFTAAANWAFPLMVGDSVVGVLKIENVLASPEVRERLQPFLKYAALVLKNELENYAKLQSVNEELNQSNEKLQEYVAALTVSNAELEQAYKDLKTAQSRILQQEKMASIGQLAAGVAHEINNPMGFIISNLGTLGKYSARLAEFLSAQDEAVARLSALLPEDGPKITRELNDRRRALKIAVVAEDLPALIKESLEGGARVRAIVQNLKGFARLDEQQYKMADLNDGLESTLAIVWNELKYKATVSKLYGDIPQTLCNPGQLNQVFMNLLVNAAQAIEQRGEVGIETRQENNSIVITISDTGSGIPEDKIDRIFEPFFTTKDVGKGTGLGLSIAYDIIKKHNGEISVESAPGKGTRFIVRIPIKTSPDTGTAKAAAMSV